MAALLRNTLLAIWDTDRRPEAEKGVRLRAPRPARFDDIKEEYSFRLKEYAIKQSNWLTQSSRYQNIWDWVRRTVEPALLVPHLELLVSQQRLSFQNVYQTLIRAQTYRVTEVEGFLVIKDFLQVKPVNCSILELDIRERLAREYEKLYGQLEKKG
ncbi:uncharacterized protein K444DRAFT_615690 [Hyaloscypha bicolor E]|uniref:Uncharacterized protein n=1 Tax=Hyaloscypha bicolor E TaxID=1095630 RepID=A0A2J6T2J6_9HELO|nr:uncharacterized protein K444DRAFT_615690 [Hyaloscypha bicolor E]PMD57229.1 hypothetical protein K444DRAFT_615690 [Hyaloscypha bicolor E]